MRLKPLSALAIVVSGACAFVPLSEAHHSIAARYDLDRPVTLQGTVAELEWMNPHIYFVVDVLDSRGNVERWSFEGGAPTSLYARGWRRDSLRPGDPVTVIGWVAKDGSRSVNTARIILADGATLLSEGADVLMLK